MMLLIKKVVKLLETSFFMIGLINYYNKCFQVVPKVVDILKWRCWIRFCAKTEVLEKFIYMSLELTQLTCTRLFETIVSVLKKLLNSPEQCCIISVAMLPSLAEKQLTILKLSSVYKNPSITRPSTCNFSKKRLRHSCFPVNLPKC